jgi:hypothetical protein
MECTRLGDAAAGPNARKHASFEPMGLASSPTANNGLKIEKIAVRYH